ncbi:hypothetical protein TNCV_1404941 [Trichonephila clavipes]|nr:hypothetical protein TNCV_1404941 [Trichonephila clavipes]
MVAKSLTWSPKMMPTWLYRQDFTKFPLNRHYNEYGTWNMEYGTSYKKSDIVNFIKIKRIKWAGNVVRMDEGSNTKKSSMPNQLVHEDRADQTLDGLMA